MNIEPLRSRSKGPGSKSRSRNTTPGSGNVLVSNNAADEHRRTTRGQIRAEIWTQHELSPFLFKLNPQSDGATSSNTSPFLAYAPNSEGSWYLRLTNEEHRKDLFSKLESNAQYISLRFLAALGCASVAWEKIRNNEVVIVKEDGVPTDLETTFMSGWKNIWDHGATAKPIILDQYFIPVRREDGSLGAYRINDEMKLNNEENIKDFKKAWYNMLLQVWEKFNTATSQGRPPRWVNVPLNREMIFQLADPKTHSVAVDEFKKAVHSLNEGKKPEKFVAWGAGTKIPPGWMEYSTNPFGLYTTYVHTEDWHAYMTGLAINTDPVRPFVLTKNESLDTAWTSYLNRHILDRREMEDLIKRIQNLGGNKEEGWDKTEELTRDQKRVLDALMRIGAREDQMEVPGSYSVKMWVVLNPTKIKRAVGRRKYEIDQTTLMGISAPAIAKSLGWKWNNPANPNGRMLNGLYMAEWLHISAFSYGGFLDDTSDNQTATSQMAENLVFGTSETNSLMTRYETAWQNLILEEDRLRKKKGEKEIFTGTLVCKINSSSHKLEYDAWEDNLNQYVRKTVKLSGGNKKLKQTSSDKTTIGELTRMAMEYPFLAYTISYKFDADTTSLILGGDDPFKLDVMFYPFSRPFFHVAEKLLDDKLFNLLLKKANPKPVESNTVDKKKKSKKKKQDMEEEKQIDTGNEDGSGYTLKKPKKWTPQEPKSNLVKGNLNLFN